MSRSRVRLSATLLLVVAVAVALVTRPWSSAGPVRTAAVACATPKAEGAPEAEHDAPVAEREREREARAAEGDADAAKPAAESPDAALFAGPGEAKGQVAGERSAPCGHRHPESFQDLARANSTRLARAVAPGTRIRAGAYRSALAQRSALTTAEVRAAVNGTDGQWSPYGDAPVETGRTEYDTSNGSTQEGLGNVAGRISAFARNASSGALYSAVANGGVYRSDNAGASWASISDGLPTQVVSGIGWSPAGGGTLIALTGDNAFGGSSLAGLGAYRSADEGRTWTHSTGIPDGLLAFKVAVDPTNPQKVYAATGGGLFVSTDAGASFVNANLPTGANAPSGTPDCSGKPTTVKDCFLANMVTDVVVQGPGNAKTANAKPGAVIAAVGWRAGNKHNVDGSEQSPGNGAYRSDDGTPNSFTNLDIAAHNSGPGGGPNPEGLSQAQIGRFALGISEGSGQDHNVLYGLISDAVKFNGGVAGLDVNDATGQKVPNSDVLNGVYVSTDFGTSWTLLEGSSTIDGDTASGSALAPPTCKAPVIGYCPGVQGWYNLWVQPDPTQQDANGVPSRLAFGLEEVWMNDQTVTQPLDGSAPARFTVIGRYFAGSSCTLLTATNGLPACPTAQGGTVPATTTHPDQHAGLFVPDGSGGVTLYAGNDGGVYKQTTDSAHPQFDNTHWGTGVNVGMHTTLPYDVAMAKDGTTYAGLQDNGEMKIDPDGRAYTVFGGDGFFSAVDPDKPDVAYEEYTGGGVSATKDGGKTWTSIDPGLTSPQFATPFEMDSGDANHLIIGGRDIQERLGGPDGSWTKVYDLGTRTQPGDAAAAASTSSPDNQLSAVDVRSYGVGTTSDLPAGPKTADQSYAGHPVTPDPLASDVSPTSYDDHTVTVGPNDGDASMDVKITFGTPDDYDLVVYRKTGATLTEVGSSAQGNTTSEEVVIPAPQPGDYVVRVRNFSAVGGYNATVKFAQSQARSSTKKSAAYVGFCGYCDTITQGTPFANGIATNVTGGAGGTAGKADGWHVAAAKNLPSRLITSVRIDPTDVATVFVTLAGYGRRWAFPGAVGEDTSKVGTGHVFKSTDGGETFTDISGNLPDTPANWSVVHKGQLIVGTDIGVFAANDTSGTTYAAMNRGLPTAPIASLRLKPGDPDLLLAATYGRGIYTYRFAPTAGATSAPQADLQNATPAAGAPGAKPAKATACDSTAGFKSIKVTPRGRGLRFDVARRLPRAFTVDLFQQAEGRRVLAQRLVKRFTNKTGSFTWAGVTGKTGKRLSNGYYFVRFTLKAPGVRDTRRVALSGSSRGFKVRRDFYARASCKLLRSAKLSGPTWGGARGTSLGVAFRLIKKGAVTVTIRRGSKLLVTRRYQAAGTSTHRVALRAKGRAPGDYLVTIASSSGSTSEKVALVSRRLK